MERGNLRLRCERKSHKWKNHEDESTEARARGGTARSSNEVCDKQMERRGGVMEPNSTANQRWEELMSEAKPFKSFGTISNERGAGLPAFLGVSPNCSLTGNWCSGMVP